MDVLAGTPMLAWLAIGIGASVSNLDGASELSTRTELLTAIARVAHIVLSLMLIASLLTRRKPVRKSTGWKDRTIAVLGAILPMTILILPRAPLSSATTQISLLLLLLGTIGSLAALSWLRPYFSILPQARGLAVNGPYRLVRHPLYLAELVTFLGLVLQFQLPWAPLLFLIAAALQIARMETEEAVLRDAFPSYADYAQGKARLIPLVY